jgi:hypothetical protein
LISAPCPDERVAHRDHDRDRCDHQHQDRHQPPGDPEERQGGLTLVGDDVDPSQDLCDPDNRRQAEQNQHERTQDGAEDIAVDRAHRHC